MAGTRRATPRRTDTSDPRRSRQRALRVLYQADLRGTSPQETLDRLDADPHSRSLLDDVDVGDALDQAGDASSHAPPIDGFARQLVLGVAEHREQIDALIARFARRWSIQRMPVVDRTVLRLATYELLHEPTPPAVVIDEAVNAAKTLSTDDSGRYINGVLESVRKDLQRSAGAGD
jgi:N utilization substance protein B